MSHEGLSNDSGPAPPDGPVEVAFRGLPVLGSPEYLIHIQQCGIKELPPEALARAFRQLPPESEAAKATLQRLFRRQGALWDYLGPLVAYARRQARKAKRDSYEDLLQDAFLRILTVLPTPRGALAERSWHTYCRRELSDAWRARHGRRGERFPVEEPFDDENGDRQTAEPSTTGSIARRYSALRSDAAPIIEAIAQRVVEEIPDEFVRAVASRAWFAPKRPKVSGQSKATEPDALPLTAVFPGKSRFQVTRALRQADSQLAAALIAAPDLEWEGGLDSLLRRLRDGHQGAAETQE